MQGGWLYVREGEGQQRMANPDLRSSRCPGLDKGPRHLRSRPGPS